MVVLYLSNELDYNKQTGKQKLDASMLFIIEH